MPALSMAHTVMVLWVLIMGARCVCVRYRLKKENSGKLFRMAVMLWEEPRVAVDIRKRRLSPAGRSCIVTEEYIGGIYFSRFLSNILEDEFSSSRFI